MVMPARPGAFIVSSGSRCSFTSWRRDSAVPCIDAVLGDHRARLPVEALAQPAEEQQPRDGRVGPVAHGDLADPPELLAPLRAGRRWTPPARARAWSAATPGRRCRRARRAGRRASTAEAGSGSFTESSSTICARSSRASTASGWPCGDHTSVARSVTTSGSTIVWRCSRWCGPTSSTTCSWHTASSPGLTSSSPVIVAHASMRRRGPAPPRRGSCARRGSGRRCRGGSGSPRATRGRRSRRG